MASSRSTSRLRDLILKSGLVDELQLRSAQARIEQWGGRLPAVLVDLGFVDEEALTQTIGKALKMPVNHLGTLVKDPAALARIDVTFCEEHAIFPVLLKDRVLTLAMADPTELGIIDAIAARVNARVQPLLTSESEIAAAISKHYKGIAVEPRSYSMRKLVTSEVPASEGGNLPESVFQLDLRAPPKPGAARSAESAPSGFLSRPPSANTLLDEMMGDEPEAHAIRGFTEEELVRLDAARLNQEKAATIMRTLTELLTEKGYLP
jgi:hypothetical protein